MKREMQVKINREVLSNWAHAKEVWDSVPDNVTVTRIDYCQCGSFAGFITRYDKFVDVAQGGVHVSYGVIDLEDMMVLDISNRHSYNLPIKKLEGTE